MNWETAPIVSASSKQHRASTRLDLIGKSSLIDPPAVPFASFTVTCQEK